MEIEIYNPTQTQPLPPVDWNYEAVKKWVSDSLEAYRGLVYTEDTVTKAKQDRAALNKLAQAIDGKRREIKALYLVPYETFEAQAKELVEMVKVQSREIDAQIKAFDRHRQEEKLEKIKAELYAPMIGDLADLVPYERLHDPKWLNISMSMSVVSEALAAKIDRIATGLDALDRLHMPEDVSQQVMSEFLRDFDLGAAMTARGRIMDERERLANYKAAHGPQEAPGAQDATQGETTPPREEKPADAREAAAGDAAAPVEAHDKIDDPKMQLDFRVWVTRKQMLALRDFLKLSGIKYGKVPKESEV